MNGKKIGIDFDGVYVNTGDLVRTVIKERYGVDVPSACLWKNVEGSEISREDFERTLDEVCEDQRYLPKLIEQPNATETISRLSEENTPRIITARTGAEFEFVKAYLEGRGLSHLLEENPRELGKDELARGLDIFVEDIPQRAISLSSIVPLVILFDTYDNAPQNLTPEETETLRKFRRISDWTQF